MSRYYFYEFESENCHTLSEIKDMIRFEGLKEKEVFEAKRMIGEDFFYCKHFGLVGEKGECGKSCKAYSPKNGVSGCCRHVGNIYEHSKKILIVLDA